MLAFSAVMRAACHGPCVALRPARCHPSTPQAICARLHRHQLPRYHSMLQQQTGHGGAQWAAGVAGSPFVGTRRALAVATAAAKSARKSSGKGRNEDLLERMVAAFKPKKALEEVLHTWKGLMENLTRPLACRMRDTTIDLDHPMGISPGRTVGRGGLPCLDVFVNVKLKHPLRVVLLRNGQFYETIGFDAVMLVEVCGLNPMALDRGLPKAGLPVANLNKEIETLLGAGLEVVMVEQYKNGATYDRAIAKVVTLASPSYKAPDVELPGMYLSSQPVVGVSWSARGAQLMVLDAEQRLLRRVEALSEEALLGMVSSTGMAALLLHHNPHSSKDARKADADPPTLFKQRIKELLSRHAVHISTYEAADPVEGFKSTAAVLLAQPGAVYAEELVRYDEMQRMRPLYPGTARQLGLIATDGMPSLLLAMVSEAAPGEVRRMWRQHLMVPPSAAVATHVRSALSILVAMGQGAPLDAAAEDPTSLLSGQGFPELSASVSFGKVLAMLPDSGELRRAADDRFLREVRDMLDKLTAVLDSPRPELQQLVDHAWPWVQEQVGSTATRQELREACQRALDAITRIVPEGEFEVTLMDSMSDDDAPATATAAAAAGYVVGHDAAIATPPPRRPEDIKPDDPAAARWTVKNQGSPKRIVMVPDPPYRQHNLLQPWDTYLWHTRGKVGRRVRDSVIAQEAAAADKAAAQLWDVADRMWQAAEQHTQQQEMASKLYPPSDHPRFVTDINSGPALWMQWDAPIKDKLVCMEDAGPDFKFSTPSTDGRGDKLSAKKDAAASKSVTCPALKAATSDFLYAVDEAAQAADKQLRQLTAQLSEDRVLLAAAANLSVALVALYEHVKMGCSSGWSIPEVGAPPEGKRTPVLTAWRQHKVVVSPVAAGAPSYASSSSSSRAASTVAIMAVDTQKQQQQQALWPEKSAGKRDSSSSSSGSSSQDGDIGASAAFAAAIVPAAAQVGAMASNRPINIRGMFPYWLPKHGDVGGTKTVLNDVHLDSSMLLTGPNMAGKSTVLRSIAAVCLLASSGCMVPADAADLPWLDAVVLRNFSGDSPKEGRSAFAMEMADMGYVLQDATNCSLVLMDELGKGTEALSGTGLSGALLEVLDAGRSYWVFATHLHLLLKLPLEVDHMARWRMVVKEEPGRDGLPRRLVPTWRLAPGDCTESLALEVAQDQGVPSDVLERAAALIQQLPSYEDMMPDHSRQAQGTSDETSSSSSGGGSRQAAALAGSQGQQAGTADMAAAGQALLSVLQPLLAAGSSSSSSSSDGRSRNGVGGRTAALSAADQNNLEAAVQQMVQALQANTTAAGSVPGAAAANLDPVRPVTQAPAASSKTGLLPPTQHELLSALNTIQSSVAEFLAPSAANTPPPDAAAAAVVADAGPSSPSGNGSHSNGSSHALMPGMSTSDAELSSSSSASTSTSSSSGMTPSTSSGLATAPPCRLHVLTAGSKLPPAMHGMPAVYAVLFGNRCADVGQSSGMAAGGMRQTRWGTEGRLKEAARRAGVPRGDLVAVLVSCPTSDVAKHLEGAVGRALQAAGWTLLRARDAQRKG